MSIPTAAALRLICVLSAAAVFATWLHAQGPTRPPGQPAEGERDLEHAQGTNAAIYAFTGACSSCHDAGKHAAPDRYTIGRLSPERVLAIMTTDAHAQHTRELSEFQKRVVAVYVAGRPLGSVPAGDAAQMKNRCVNAPPLTPARGSEWNGWGADAANTRFQPEPGLDASSVPRLALKWAFGFPNGNSAYGQPSVVGGRVFVGADTGYVYSLDSASGCVHWSFQAMAGVRTAVPIGAGTERDRFLAYFGDVKGNVYALNAETGAQVWQDRADTHPLARVVGTPTLVDGRLYVAVSSLEESGAGNPVYPCCTFRGSLVAYDALTGKRIWTAYTVADAAKPLKKTSIGTQLHGPAGAAVWSAPTVDRERRVVYVATGNGYTHPAVDTSNALIAFDLESGQRLWAKQVLPFDAYVRDCPGAFRPNVPPASRSETCPETLGPDMDFGNAPILRRLSDGRTLIIVGQKDGTGWAFDADGKGAIVWKPQLGVGTIKGYTVNAEGQYQWGGGMVWGSAADAERAYFPVTGPGGALGMAAVRLDTGDLAWRARPGAGGGAPVSVIPGVVFFAAGNGMVYAYATDTGQSLWQFNTAQSFTTVNGVAAKGGNINGAGPVIAERMLFVTSGYTDLGNGVRGNVLLAFDPR
jgi:polyvinyl alcohol dehydrogenase (cytochrome)